MYNAAHSVHDEEAEESDGAPSPIEAVNLKQRVHLAVYSAAAGSMAPWTIKAMQPTPGDSGHSQILCSRLKSVRFCLEET